MKSSPFCRSSSESVSKSASAVREPVIATWKPSWPFSRRHQVGERNDLVASHHERHHGRVAVLRDERLVVRGVVTLRVFDDAELLPARADGQHFRPERRVVDRVAVGAHDHDLARSRLRREAVTDEGRRLLRVGVARDVTVARQGVTEQKRDHHEGDENGNEPCGKRALRVGRAGSRETFCGDGHARSLLMANNARCGRGLMAETRAQGLNEATATLSPAEPHKRRRRCPTERCRLEGRYE